MTSAETKAAIDAARQATSNGDGNPSGAVPPVEGSGYRADWLDSSDFLSRPYKLEWYVKNLLVARQPIIIGGPRKSLKTNLMVDLAVSLAAGVPFLGEFQVYKPLKVVLLSGETGEAILQETAKRICKAKQLDTASLHGQLFWGFDLPQLANPVDLAAMSGGLRQFSAQVAIIDPLYLALLAGTTGVEAQNLFQMGPILHGVAKACDGVGCTPALIHHARKNLAEPYQPMEMEDLAYAGIQEFARQWLLVNRRKSYEPGSGRHEMWLSAGGSAGQSGCWGINIDEGQQNDELTSRTWTVEVLDSAQARGEASQARNEQAQEQKAQKVKAEGVRLLNAIDKIARKEDGWAGYTKARALAHLNGDNMIRAVDSLVAEGVLEDGTMETMSGKGNKTAKATKAIRRRRAQVTGGTDGTKPRKKRGPVGG